MLPIPWSLCSDLCTSKNMKDYNVYRTGAVLSVFKHLWSKFFNEPLDWYEKNYMRKSLHASIPCFALQALAFPFMPSPEMEQNRVLQSWLPPLLSSSQFCSVPHLRAFWQVPVPVHWVCASSSLISLLCSLKNKHCIKVGKLIWPTCKVFLIIFFNGDTEWRSTSVGKFQNSLEKSQF